MATRSLSISSPKPASITSAIPTRWRRSCVEFYEASGGFGTLLIVTGKKWATREKVFRSMRLFMEQVAPKLRDLVPAREPDTVAA